jgi:hypothetical protein
MFQSSTLKYKNTQNTTNICLKYENSNFPTSNLTMSTTRRNVFELFQNEVSISNRNTKGMKDTFSFEMIDDQKNKKKKALPKLDQEKTKNPRSDSTFNFFFVKQTKELSKTHCVAVREGGGEGTIKECKKYFPRKVSQNIISERKMVLKYHLVSLFFCCCN